MSAQPTLNVAVKKVDGHKVKLEVSVGSDEVARAYEQAYRRLAGRVDVPGFRRGKAPRPVLERHVGPAAVREEALDLILPGSYSNALVAKDLDPIDRPEVEVVTFQEGQAFVFRATVEVKPEVKLGPYKGLDLSVPVNAVKPEDVERQLEAVREDRAELEPAEPGTALIDGMFAVIDYHGTIDGTPFPGGDAEGALVQLGAGRLEAPLEEALKGARAGEERECTLTFPADHSDPNLREKLARVNVTVKEVKSKKLPELSDELAKEVAGVDLGALRERIARSLEDRARQEAREELVRLVTEKVTEVAEVDVPEKLVTRRIERMNADMSERLRGQGLDVDRYLEIVGLEKDRWERDQRARAEHIVKKDLVLEAIARREGIQATDPEVEFEVARVAAAYHQKPEKTRAFFLDSPDRLDSLRAGIISRKTVAFLVRENSASEPVPESTPSEVTSAAAERGSAKGRGAD